MLKLGVRVLLLLRENGCVGVMRGVCKPVLVVAASSLREAARAHGTTVPHAVPLLLHVGGVRARVQDSPDAPCPATLAELQYPCRSSGLEDAVQWEAGGL